MNQQQYDPTLADELSNTAARATREGIISIVCSVLCCAPIGILFGVWAINHGKSVIGDASLVSNEAEIAGRGRIAVTLGTIGIVIGVIQILFAILGILARAH